MKVAKQQQRMQDFDEINQLVVDVLTVGEMKAHTLHRSLIQTRPALFQGRDFTVAETRASSETQRETLLGVLKNGDALPPLRVWKAGGVWWLLQGHHRLAAHEAYATLATRKPRTLVNVTICQARTLQDALDETNEEGAHFHLNKTQEELSNLGWDLVKAGALQTKAITRQTRLSRSQVKVMRQMFTRLSTQYPLGGWGAFTWAQAQRWSRTESGGGEMSVEERMTLAAMKALQQAGGGKLLRYPRAILAALARLNVAVPPQAPNLFSFECKLG